jgi:hypothetical protein
VLEDNVPMRHLLTKAGAKWQLDGPGVLQTTMDLPRVAGPLDPTMVLAVARAAAHEGHRRSA